MCIYFIYLFYNYYYKTLKYYITDGSCRIPQTLFFRGKDDKRYHFLHTKSDNVGYMKIFWYAFHQRNDGLEIYTDLSPILRSEHFHFSHSCACVFVVCVCICVCVCVCVCVCRFLLANASYMFVYMDDIKQLHNSKLKRSDIYYKTVKS